MRSAVTENIRWWAPRPQDQQARLIRRPVRRAAIAAAAALGFAALLGSAAVDPGRAPQVGDRGQVIAAPSMLALSAGCEGVTTWPDRPAENGYLDPASSDEAETGEPLFGWRLSPPVSGNFADAWTGPKAVAPDAADTPAPEQAVALLYRGWTVVWYAPTAPDDEVAQLLAWAGQLPDDATILAAPWPDDAPSWRPDRVIIATAWGITQPCKTFDGELVKEFAAAAPDAPGAGLPLDETGPAARANTIEVLRAELEAEASQTPGD